MSRVRNEKWEEWFIGAAELHPSSDPYGEAQTETIELLSALGTHATILDLAGGYGRNALPLAQDGCNVTIVDVDRLNLEEAARRKTAALNLTGKLHLVQAEAIEPLPLKPACFDGLLSAGLLFLMPPAEARAIFTEALTYLKFGGLVVVEFITERRNTGTEDLVGDKEQVYTKSEGLEFVRSMFEENGLSNFGHTEKKISVSIDQSYSMQGELLIAHGIKTASPADSG